MKKRSFFERISGSMNSSEDYDPFEDDVPAAQNNRTLRSAMGGASPVAPAAVPAAPARAPSLQSHLEDDSAEGQLPVDVYQTPNEIVIRAFIAGVRPDEINLSISRDMVVIEGSREEREQILDADYSVRELFWGSFSRTVLLPTEIDVDSSSATAKDGLLTLILPKLDKTRQTKLKVRMG